MTLLDHFDGAPQTRTTCEAATVGRHVQLLEHFDQA
jgi:hypothetical protein